MVGRVGRLLLLLLLLRLRLLLLLLLLLRRLLLALLPLPPGRLLPSLHLPSHYSHHLDPYAGTGTVFLLLSSGVGGGQDLTLLNRSVTFRQRSKPKPAPPAAQIPALRPKLHQPPQPRDTVVQARIGLKQLRVVEGQQVVEGDVLGHSAAQGRMKRYCGRVCRRISMATPSLLVHFSTGTRASVTISFTSKPHSWLERAPSSQILYFLAQIQILMKCFTYGVAGLAESEADACSGQVCKTLMSQAEIKGRCRNQMQSNLLMARSEV